MYAFDLEEYRAIFRAQVDEPARPFGLERRPLFSPAAAAQEPANTQRMWRRWGNTFIPWEFSGWLEEALAVHKTAFMGDWSAVPKVGIKGAASQAFLEHIGVADLTKLVPGRIRHFVMTNEHGKVASEGVLGRLSEHEYFYTGGGVEWLLYQLGRGSWEASAELLTPDYFIFEIQGPKSLDIMESVTGRLLRDLPFNHWVAGTIKGAEVRILRTGVSGELGYEIHGVSEVAADVWSAVAETGAEKGLVLLGHRSQVLAHVEAGIATIGFDYVPSTISSPAKGQSSVIGPGHKTGGTYPVTRIEDLFRSPFELNWCSKTVVQRKEFIGSDALRNELASGGPSRRLVGLVWNTQDVIDIYASLFREDEGIAPQMEMPRRYAAEYLSVLDGGRLCGCATSRTYSPYLRKVISLATIDRELATPERAVTVLWEGGQQAREIKAHVIELPFKPDHRRADVQKLK